MGLGNKYIVIGDIHGRTIWKQLTNYLDEGYVLLFLGDYFDTHDNISLPEIHYNILNIITLKEEFPNQVIMLAGNHDYSYLNSNGVCSGYNSYTQNFVTEHIELFKKNLKLVHCDGDFLFSHAGVTQTFLDLYGISIDVLKSLEIDDDRLAFRNLTSDCDLSGDNIYQSPIWVRPYSLSGDYVKGFKQIVGHTPVPFKDIWHFEETIYLNDRLGINQYMKVENDKVSLLNI